MATMPRQLSSAHDDDQPAGFLPRRGSDRNLVCKQLLSLLFITLSRAVPTMH